MQKELKVNNNENLIRNTFQFLNVKDLSLASQVNHLFRKSSNHFNLYWRDFTKQHFCSNIEHYNILNSPKECKLEESKQETTDWKFFLKLGIEIKNSWNRIVFTSDDQTSEMIPLRNEIFGTLKEFYSLPKLRKENLYVESDINTILQTFLYDFVYDQQDLYDYYDPYLKDYADHMLDINHENLEVRTPGIPFSHCLTNFEEQLYIFENEMHKLTLAKLRWYQFEDDLHFTSELDNSLSLNKKLSSILMMDEAESNFKYSPFNLNFDLINETSLKFQDNGLLSFFTTFIFSVTYFCKLNYKIILTCSGKDEIFLNEYVKRHKSYTDAAIYLNDQLENFNVLVNYLYENSFKNYPDFPKFSVFRLMMIVWYREVLGPLEEQNLISHKASKLFKNYIIKEINKTFETHNLNYKIKLKDSPLKELIKEDIELNFSLEGYNNIHNNNMMLNELAQVNKSNMNTQTTILLSATTSANFNSFSTQNSFTQPSSSSSNKEKGLLNEDVGSFEFQTEYFIEQYWIIINRALISLIDFSSNEFSVYFINSSKMHANKHYDMVETKMVSFIDDLTKNFKKSKIELLGFFKNNDFIKSKLINRTRFRIVETICNNMIKLSSEEVETLFDEYIAKYSNTCILEAQNYLKLHGDVPELLYEKLYEHLLEISSKKNLSSDICKFLCLNFIREASKNKSHPIHLLEESTEWLKDEEEIQAGTDELISSENARRHITLKREHEEKMYNFTSNLTWENILQIYNNEIKPKMKTQNKFLDFSGSSNLDLIDTNNNNLNENNELDNNNSMDIDILSLGKR